MSFREMLQTYLDRDQIERIRGTLVGIAGAGGLGSNCAVALARSGFERFVIADFDIVEWSNLNQQHYFPVHIGRPKVDCLVEVISSINPEISVRAARTRVSEVNVVDLFKDCDIVVEAFDSAVAKAMLVGHLLSCKKRIVCGSGLAGFGRSDRLRTWKMSRDVVVIGDLETEVGDQAKPYGPCVLVAAAKMADAVLSLTLGEQP